MIFQLIHTDDNNNSSIESNTNFPSNSDHNDICGTKANTSNFEKDENKEIVRLWCARQIIEETTYNLLAFHHSQEC